MKQIVFDIEANGLDDATKIHCLSYCVMGEYKVITLYDYDDMREFLNQEAIFIGHYICNYDLPLMTKLLGIDFTGKSFYDTLFLSNYIYPGLKKYGLEDFGVMFGLAKTKVDKDEWDGDMADPDFKILMTQRCETDVKINTNLWVNIMKRFSRLYDGDDEQIKKLLNYLSFKAAKAYSQQINPLLIDVEAGSKLLVELYEIKEQKDSLLRSAMPKNPVYKVKSMPKIMYNKDGKLSSHGIKWFQFLDEYNLPHDTVKDVRYISEYVDPNPQSDTQKKDWLYSLGWTPTVFRWERNKVTNERKSIPQILNENKELNPCVEVLLEKEPALKELEGLGVINHRIAFVEGLIKEASKNGGWVSQTLHALTSTIRWKHRNIVNVPSQGLFAKEIRSLFIPPVGYKLIGADLQSLESKIRDHSIIEIDPKYVEEMSAPDFDAHMDIALRSGILTPQQVQDHKDGVADYSKERKAAKRLNFSAIYGVAKKTLSITTGFSEDKCEQLISGYWERNWSVRTFSESLEIKKCLGFEWVRSPISGFYLELRTRKDTFSAVTQHGGVFMFDTWQMYARHFGLQTVAEFHDECIIYTKEDKVEESVNILNKSCKLANKRLGMRVTINITAKSGDNYYQIH